MSIISFREWYDLTEAAIDERYPYKAVFTAGGPGSGKSWVADHMFDHLGFKKSNSDEIAKLLARKCKESDVMQSTEGQPGYDRKQQLGTQAIGLTQKFTSCWASNGLPYVIDITGRNVGLVKSIKSKLEQEGYDVYMVFVSTSLETTLRRVSRRVMGGGHAVDEPYQRQTWDEAMKNLEIYKSMFGSKIDVIPNDADITDKRDQAMLGLKLSKRATRLLGPAKTVENPIGRAKLQDVQGWYVRQRGGSNPISTHGPVRPPSGFSSHMGSVSKMAPKPFDMDDTGNPTV